VCMVAFHCLVGKINRVCRHMCRERVDSDLWLGLSLQADGWWLGRMAGDECDGSQAQFVIWTVGETGQRMT